MVVHLKIMIQKKKIKCKECGKDCYTGQRSMCSVCYRNYQKEKAKKEKNTERAKIKREKAKAKKSISKTNILTLIQKLVRVCNEPVCITCDKVPFGTNIMTGGHFISRRKNSTCYLVENINPQCSYCNSDQSTSGKSYLHGAKIDQQEEGLSMRLWRMSQVTYSFGRDELYEMSTKVKEALKKVETLETLEEKKEVLKEFEEYQKSTNWYKAILKLSNHGN